MKAGVRMLPCGVRITPVRAAPSVFVISKQKCAHAATGITGRHRHRNRSDSVPQSLRHKRVSSSSSPQKARDQHEQRRARQMEIGQQHLGRFESIARRDEDVGLAFEGLRACPSASPRVSSVRNDVVPTATIRPPLRARGIQRVRPSPARAQPIRRACDVLPCPRQSPAGMCRRRHAASQLFARMPLPRAAPEAPA